MKTRPVNPNGIMSLSEASAYFDISEAAIRRMAIEGVIQLAEIGDDGIVIGREVQRVIASAKDDPGLLTCECNGPCCC